MVMMCALLLGVGAQDLRGAILEYCNWALVIDPPFRDLFLRFSHCVRMPIMEADRGWA